MGDVQEAIAAPLNHFELVIEAFHKPTRLPVQKVVRDLVEAEDLYAGHSLPIDGVRDMPI